jgi:polysaccharide biosynthesis protein PslJ
LSSVIVPAKAEGGIRQRSWIATWTVIIINVSVLALAIAAVVSREGLLIALGVLGVLVVTVFFTISRRNAQTVLTLVVVLLFLLPQDYVLIGPLRSVGNPAQLVGMLALAFWCAGRILGLIRADEGHPIRWVILLYGIGAIAAFAAAMSSSTLTVEESTGAARALFPVAAALGIGLLAVDGLGSREGVETMLQRLVWVGGVAALIGILEFAIHGFSYRETMHLPGLTINTEVINDTRSGFNRIHGAASHPIEYAVALAALAPLALNFVVHAKTRVRRQLSMLALLLICVVIPMTIARSGVVAVAVGVLIYATHLSNRAKLNLAVLGVIALGLYRAAVPGLLGTLKSLLLVGEADPSIAGRTEDYAKIPGLTAGFEAFGRGLGTFQPLSYFYLDNQYLGSLLEGGVLGLAILITTYVVGFAVARGVRHRSGDESLRGLGQALAASIAAFAVSAATFDELSFRQAAFTLFFLLGCAGALWSTVQGNPKRRWSGRVKTPKPAQAAVAA